MAQTPIVINDDHWKIVGGVVVRGYGVASGQGAGNPYPDGTIALQKPFFAARGLDLAAYMAGTLNISIAPATFQLLQPAYLFRRVAWTTLHQPEDFSFARCRLTFSATRYDGWVYYPHPETKERHVQQPSMLELIMPFVPKIGYGDAVQIAVPTNEILLVDQ